VLRRINERGWSLPTHAQRTVYDKQGTPIASADFFYEPKKLVVFVDGPPHDKDYVASADEGKRKKLKALGYRVLAIQCDEMDDGLLKLGQRL
jgi:very-short-patch-repair endonuclease